MRGWIVALSILGIAAASTGSLIGERAHVATAIDWSNADFEEREATGRILAALERHKGMADEELTSGGQIAAALADSTDAPGAQDEVEDRAGDGESPSPPKGPVRVPSITSEDEADEPAPSRAAAPATVEVAPRPIEAAPLPRPSTTPVARPVEPAPSEPLAIVCMAGCGAKKVVYEAVPVASRPERVGGMLQVAVANERNSPPVIECVAGCYGATPRTYTAPNPPPMRQVAIHGDVGFERPWMRTEREMPNIRVQSGTRTRRIGN